MRRLAALLLVTALGCNKAQEAPTDASPSPGEGPPSIRVTADRKDLVFSYAKEDGSGYETATSIDGIPPAARRAVVVTDLSLTPEQRLSGRYVYIADLRAPRADGTFPVAIASRYAFEAKSTATSSTSPGGAAGKEVIMYSASWCGVCKQARRLMNSWGVRFTEKDIEASRSAAEELAAKARAGGFQMGGVPVIDVGGTILQGLDEATLKAVLKEKGFI